MVCNKREQLVGKRSRVKRNLCKKPSYQKQML